MVQGHTSETAHRHYVMHDAPMVIHASLANQIVNGSPQSNPTPSNLVTSTVLPAAASTPTRTLVGSVGTIATPTSLATPGSIRLNIQELLMKTLESDIQVDVAVMPWGTQHPHFLKGPNENVPWTATEIAFIGGKIHDTSIELYVIKHFKTLIEYYSAAYRANPRMKNILSRCRNALSLDPHYRDMVPHFHKQHIINQLRFSHGLDRFLKTRGLTKATLEEKALL